MTLLLRDADVVACADPVGLISAIESALIQESDGTAIVVPRQNARYPHGNYRHMAAILPDDDVMGFKIFHGSASRGMRYMVGVYSCTEGDLLGLLDASYLTAARTGAVTAVGYKHLLGSRRARRLGIIGSGLEARTNLEAMLAVRRPEHISVFSPNPERRRAFIRDMADHGVEIEDASDAQQALAGADVVLAATNTRQSRSPIAVSADWVEPGALLLSIGSTLPDLREVDERLYANAADIVVDAPGQAEKESGDLIAAAALGSDLGSRVRSLADIVSGRLTLELSGSTAFKSVGTGAQDVGAALAVYRRARELGIGQDVGELLSAKVFFPPATAAEHAPREDEHARIR